MSGSTWKYNPTGSVPATTPNFTGRAFHQPKGVLYDSQCRCFIYAWYSIVKTDCHRFETLGNRSGSQRLTCKCVGDLIQVRANDTFALMMLSDTADDWVVGYDDAYMRVFLKCYIVDGDGIHATCWDTPATWEHNFPCWSTSTAHFGGSPSPTWIPSDSRFDLEAMRTSAVYLAALAEFPDCVADAETSLNITFDDNCLA